MKSESEHFISGEIKDPRVSRVSCQSQILPQDMEHMEYYYEPLVEFSFFFTHHL